MKTLIFTASILGIGFLMGYGDMWGKWHDDRERIENAPYSQNFERLLWSVEHLKEKNEGSALISDLYLQAAALDSFFNQLKEERIKESDPIVLYAGVIVPILGFVAFWTRPRKTQPVDADNPCNSPENSKNQLDD